MNAFVTANDGTRLHTEMSGAGRDVILCHGGPGLWDYLESLARLIDGEAKVHRWDQRGCGRSEGNGPYTIARAVADMEAIRERAGADRWLVGGHSWGAELALHYAVAHPERCSGLLYISGRGLIDSWLIQNRAVCRGREEARMTPAQRQRRDFLGSLPARDRSEEREFRLLSWLPDVAPAADAEQVLAGLIDAPHAINFEANAGLTEDNRRVGAGVRAALATLKMPVLIVHGAHDPRPVDGAVELNALLPDSQLEVVQTGHVPWAEDPAATSAILKQYMDQLR